MGVVSGPGLAAYSASKTGVIGLTKAAAIDLAGEGIRVNALCPGGIGQTAITENPANLAAMEQLRMATPMQRLGTPDHIAETVLWLCSPGAAYMTGQAITVDGGYTLW
jgi:NAD(P)-dependent dehydrogenase (short-subunit alcohol dehydrogenase family)